MPFLFYNLLNVYLIVCILILLPIISHTPILCSFVCYRVLVYGVATGRQCLSVICVLVYGFTTGRQCLSVIEYWYIVLLLVVRI